MRSWTPAWPRWSAASSAAAGGGRRAVGLPGGPALARRQVPGHQRLPQGDHRGGLHSEGLPDVERHRAGRLVPRPRGDEVRLEDLTQTQVVKEVAKHMGNTAAVCRSSYIDPRVFDRHDGGLTIEGATELLEEVDGHWPEIQPTVEEATIHLIEDTPTLARVA